MKQLCKFGFGVFLILLAGSISSAQSGFTYNETTLGGSPYTQLGPSPAYGGAYAAYGRNADGITSRFNWKYGPPGYGRFGAGSSYGTGPLRAAGTGYGGPSGKGMFQRGRLSRNSEEAQTLEHLAKTGQLQKSATAPTANPDRARLVETQSSQNRKLPFYPLPAPND